MKRIVTALPLLVGLILSCVYMALGVTHEAPVGVVEGTVVMAESGKGLPHAMIYLEPQPYTADLPYRSVQADAKGHFRIRSVAVGRYNLDASSAAHSLKPMSVLVTDGGRLRLNLSLKPNAPSLDLQASQHVFTPTEQGGVHIHGFVPQSSISVTITRLSADRIAEAGGLNATFTPLNGRLRQLGPENYGRLVTTIHRTLRKDVEGVFFDRLRMPVLPEGIYWVECLAGPLHAGSYLNITHIGLISKYYRSKLLTYVVDIASGLPLSGVPIYTGSPTGLKLVAHSDASGVAQTTLTTNQKSVIVARDGGSLAVCERQFADMTEHSGPNTVFLYTDRPIYRPGDTIQFKGIVRKLDGEAYLLPAGGPVDATLLDGRGAKVATIKLPMGPHGTFHGSFTTSSEVAPGDFRIEAGSDSGTGSVDVPVAEYRKPNYTITVLPGRAYYVLGQQAKATISCQYYYGGPVVGAKVQVSIFRSEDWQSEFDNAEDESDAVGPEGLSDEFVGGDYTQSVNAVTDATGQAVIEFPTRAGNDPADLATDYVYTISASVADVGDKYFEGSGNVRVTRGDLRLNLHSSRYVASPGDLIPFTATLKPELNSGESVANRTIEFVAGTEDWDGATRTFKPLKKVQAVTDGRGRATVPFTAGNTGDLTVRALVLDDAGHRIRAEADLYISGDQGFVTQSDRYSITATLDRRRYQVGDTAKLLLQTGKPGGSALVTIQADSIITEQVVHLTQRATMLTLPIDVRMTPNAYVSVAYIKDENYMEANRELTVSRTDRDLSVTVTPDRPTAKPGDKVTFDVATLDSHGRPVSADASLSVVDEAIYAVRKDTTDVRAGFYPHRTNDVQTSYSFPEIYLDGGDKGSGQMPVRSRFLDTAWWTPNVQTGLDGHAKVTVTLPDNLTRWRATAVACSDNALVGMGANDVTARKDLMVTLQSPRYLISGDHQSAVITVTNDTGRDADVLLKLYATGLTIDRSLPESLHVDTGKAESVRVDLIAGPTGEALVTAEARLAEGGGDAVRMPVRIVPHGEPVVTARSGETADATSVKFTRRPDVDLAGGGLRLTLSPSLATDLIRPMSTLVDYPYGCVEQTMSRFLPSVLVTEAFRKLGLPAPKLSDRLPAITADSFARLSRFQHADGGWGWWEYDESSPFMTALVLDGVKRAQEAGHAPPASLGVKEALDWGQKWLKIDPKLRDDNHDSLYLAYVLARYGRRAAAERALAEVDENKLHPSELAFAALARGALGEDAEPLLARLRRLAKHGPDGVRWSAMADMEWGEESTAVVLLAFVNLAPGDSLIPEIVRGLMAHRMGDAWYSTRDTAYILVGLSMYIQHTHEAVAPEQVEIAVNGKPVKRVTLDPRQPQAASETVDLPISELPVGDLTIQLRRSGSTGGRVYFGATLTQIVTAPSFKATSSEPGLTVSRKFFLLEPQPISDGTLRLLPSARPIERAPSGSIIRCEITITSDRPRRYLQVECPTPSNCHVTDREGPGDGEVWSWWWSGTVIRADRIAFFAQAVPKGVQQITYTMRAESPGTSAALPVVVTNMYDPRERASSADDTLDVVR